MSGLDAFTAEIEQLVARADAALRALSRTVLEKRQPPSGAYGFFHHSSHSIARLTDCGLILQRMVNTRRLLTQLAYEKNRVMPRDWPAGTPFPEEMQAVLRRDGQCVEHMKLDHESLYLFGGILLDQWAFQALAVGGTKSKTGNGFADLVDVLEAGSAAVFSPLWANHRDDILWMHYQLRFYRNRFIVHADRPWQRGTGHSVYGDDFNLHTPSPPGWLDDAALDSDILSLLPLAPEAIRRDPRRRTHPGAVIEAMFDDIGRHGPADRKRIADLFKQKGGSTPNFQVLARRLLRLIALGTETLIPIAEANAASVILGDPHSTSAELSKRWRAGTSPLPE